MVGQMLTSQNKGMIIRIIVYDKFHTCNYAKVSLSWQGCGPQIAHRRWAGKTSFVRLAPEHVFTIEHLRRTE